MSGFLGKLRILTVKGFLGRLLQVIAELVVEFLTVTDVLEYPLYFTGVLKATSLLLRQNVNFINTTLTL